MRSSIGTRAGFPLHDAARANDIRAIESLLTSGVWVNEADQRGRTAIHVAVKYGKLDAVRLLLRRGADVNAVDRQNHTPLHQAAICEELEIVRELLDKGADPRARDKEGYTVLMQAALTAAANKAVLEQQFPELFCEKPNEPEHLRNARHQKAHETIVLGVKRIVMSEILENIAEKQLSQHTDTMRDVEFRNVQQLLNEANKPAYENFI